MSRRDGRLLLWAALAVLVASPLAADQEIGQVEVEVVEGTAHALCTEGPRRVVLLPGEMGTAESWRPVLQRLSGRVGACAYDRLWAPGGAHAAARGWFELMDELQDVHAALGFEPGYTLVGHSIAGLYARLLVMDRPLAVGGLVLIDPAHEDMPDAVMVGMPTDAWSWWVDRRRRPNADGVLEEALAAHAGGRRLPDIPVTVITATRRKDGDGWDARIVSEAVRRVHASILGGLRSARHIPADGSGHEVHIEAPDLVAREIERMVDLTIRTER